MSFFPWKIKAFSEVQGSESLPCGRIARRCVYAWKFNPRGRWESQTKSNDQVKN